MPIKTTPFENPFRNIAKKNTGAAKVIIHKGQIYEKVVRKK